MILQSWFKKSLDTCVLGGDTECQVPQSCFDLFPPENSFLLLSTNIEGRTIIYSSVEICLLLVLLSQILCNYFGFFHLSLGWFWLSGTSAELLLWVKQVAGIFYILKMYKNFIFKHSFQAMLGPIQQNWAANGQVQH